MQTLRQEQPQNSMSPCVRSFQVSSNHPAAFLNVRSSLVWHSQGELHLMTFCSTGGTHLRIAWSLGDSHTVFCLRFWSKATNCRASNSSCRRRSTLSAESRATFRGSAWLRQMLQHVAMTDPAAATSHDVFSFLAYHSHTKTHMNTISPQPTVLTRRARTPFQLRETKGVEAKGLQYTAVCLPQSHLLGRFCLVGSDVSELISCRRHPREVPWRTRQSESLGETGA